MEKKKYPIGPEFYILNEEVGQGVSAAVHRALCIPFDEIVAIKILDFERYNCDLVIFIISNITLSFCVCVLNFGSSSTFLFALLLIFPLQTFKKVQFFF